MISIIEKHGLFTIKRVWFKKEIDTKCTLLRLMRIGEPIDSKTAYNELSYTPISDLTLEENDLLMKVRKTCRNEIRRAEKDGLEILFFDSATIINNIEVLNEFVVAYKKFAEELKNETVSSAYNRDKILQYLKANCFFLSEAKKDQLSVYHAYVSDEDEAVLIYSVSDFRDDNVDRNLAGRANRYLHFQDMMMFKHRGVKFYDWGNISNPEIPNGIDNFKLSFGGDVKRKYNVLVGCNFVGKLFVRLYGKRMEARKK